MTTRFDDLKKIPGDPATRLLAANNAKLKTPLTAPASAPVPVLLAELEAAGEYLDMVRLLSVALPPREAVWWACLAARDVVGDPKESICLGAAEEWVFRPTEEARTRLGQVVDTQTSGDRAALCATAAYYAPGTLGQGDMAEHPAPIGVVAACTFGMTLKTLDLVDDPDDALKLAIERALDIARGGNGAITLEDIKGGESDAASAAREA